MSKLLLFDFECPKGHLHEDLQAGSDNTPLVCPECGEPALRTISGTRLDPDMGLTNDFPTMADRWAKKTRARAKNDKLTDNANLLMY